MIRQFFRSKLMLAVVQHKETRHKCTSSRQLTGLTAIVTGANGGIGKEVAKDLYQRGARVILACRKKDNAASTRIELSFCPNHNPGQLIDYELDLSRRCSVRKFAKKVLEKEEQINILVCNAGVMTVPLFWTEDHLELQLATNYVGHSLLTLLLLPRLKRSATPANPSRVVFVSSVLHKIYNLDPDNLDWEADRAAYTPMKGYSNSKSAMIMFASELSKRMREKGINGINTYSLHPGVVRTDIGRHFQKTYMAGGTWVFRNLMGWALKTPKGGAQTIIYCAVDEKTKTESGLYYSECRVTQPARHCRDVEKLNKVWTKTMGLLDLEAVQHFDFFGDADPQIVQ